MDIIEIIDKYVKDEWYLWDVQGRKEYLNGLI